jgi:hypothetical protein
MNKFHTVENGFSTLVPVVLTEVVHLKEDGTIDGMAHKAIQIHENLPAAEKFISAYNSMAEGKHNSRAYLDNSYNMELRDLMNTKKWDFMGMSYHSFR